MRKEALQIQVHLMAQLTEVALDIEKNGANHSVGDKMFEIDEAIGLLKVMVGDNSAAYKQMNQLKEQIELKITANKDPTHFY